MSMGCVHNILLMKVNHTKDGQVAAALESAIIHDDVISYIDEQIGYENNLFYQVPSINPSFVGITYSEMKPKGQGFNQWGETIFNQHSIKHLQEMFFQWKEIIENMPEDFFIGLGSEYEYDHADLLRNISLCLKFTEAIKKPNYYLYHGGI